MAHLCQLSPYHYPDRSGPRCWRPRPIEPRQYRVRPGRIHHRPVPVVLKNAVKPPKKHHAKLRANPIMAMGTSRITWIVPRSPWTLHGERRIVTTTVALDKASRDNAPDELRAASRRDSAHSIVLVVRYSNACCYRNDAVVAMTILLTE